MKRMIKVAVVVVAILVTGFVGVCLLSTRHEVTVKSTDQVLDLEDDWDTTDWNSETVTYWEE